VPVTWSGEGEGERGGGGETPAQSTKGARKKKRGVGKRKGPWNHVPRQGKNRGAAAA
jgi:hypothetical protein